MDMTSVARCPLLRFNNNPFHSLLHKATLLLPHRSQPSLILVNRSPLKAPCPLLLEQTASFWSRYPKGRTVRKVRCMLNTRAESRSIACSNRSSSHLSLIALSLPNPTHRNPLVISPAMSTRSRQAYKTQELLALRDSVSENAVTLPKFTDDEAVKGKFTQSHLIRHAQVPHAPAENRHL
jgi:hypothetical protein